MFSQKDKQSLTTICEERSRESNLPIKWLTTRLWDLERYLSSSHKSFKGNTAESKLDIGSLKVMSIPSWLVSWVLHMYIGLIYSLNFYSIYSLYACFSTWFTLRHDLDKSKQIILTKIRKGIANWYREGSNNITKWKWWTFFKNNREFQSTSVQVLSHSELHRALTNIYCYMF